MLTSTEFDDALAEIETWWELSGPWKRRIDALYLEFSGFTLGAIKEAIRAYGNYDRADYCPSPKKLWKLANEIHQRRIKEGIDPADTIVRCADRGHTWALASPVDIALAANGGALTPLNTDTCVTCHTTRPHEPERTNR